MMKTILSCSNSVLVLARFVACSAVKTLRKGETMKVNLLISVLCLMSVATLATKRSDYSGSWQFNPEKSKNIGMMAQMKMIQTIEQSDLSLDVRTHTTFQGRDEDSKTHYDLTGKPATNESPMGGPSETVSKWDGGKLVTTWTSESAVAAGPKVVRIETRSLSADGKTMTVESVRGSNPAILMVFEKKQ
jgi:hypothetical protein